jgi:hypothetical protein
MVKRGTMKYKIESSIFDHKRKVLMVMFCAFALAGSLAISTGLRFSAYGATDWNGTIGLDGMFAEGTWYAGSSTDAFNINYDGAYDFVRTDFTKWPDLDGAPQMAPETDWMLGSLQHIDATSQQGILEANIPSVYGATDNGKYYETYYYTVDLSLKLHAIFGSTGWYDPKKWLFETNDAIDFVYQSHYIAELSPIEDLYAKVNVKMFPTNASIVYIAADLASNGAAQVTFYPWSSNPSWNNGLTVTETKAQIDKYCSDNKGNPVIFNRQAVMPGFDSRQSFNVKSVDEDNHVYTFMVGYDRLGVTAVFWAYKDIFNPLIEYSDMKIYDIKIDIPMTLAITMIYDIQVDLGTILNPGNTGTTTTTTTDILGNIVMGIEGKVEPFVNDIRNATIIALVIIGAISGAALAFISKK